MKILKELNKKESGQAFILILILLLVGGLIIAPLMAFMSTGLIAGQAIEEKVDEVYAADAGIEDGIYNIITPGAPNYELLQALDEGATSDPVILTDINGLSVSYTITKLNLLQGLLGGDEINLNASHTDWVEFVISAPVPGPDNVEYTGYIQITLPEAAGQVKLESVGAYFAPSPGVDENLVLGPYDYLLTATGVMDFAYLDGLPETKFVSGGFAFIWRFEKNTIFFDPPDDPEGGFSFKFTVYDPSWAPSPYSFVWATFTRQDVSYAIGGPDLYKWLIEATAGDTTVRSVVVTETGGASILTWEINPPEPE